MATQAREPDSETAEKATRRNFTAAYKRKILAQTDQANEGLYSSLLSTWRRQRDEGTLGALKPKKRATIRASVSKTPRPLLWRAQYGGEQERGPA